MREGHLPVHGFVLAGGRSTRMGRDKALLLFRGRPMVELAVEKLRTFCSAVSIVGERPDLAAFAPVVRGERPGAGPAAGIEVGLIASRQPWAVFLPVDVPLVPPGYLEAWVKTALQDAAEVSFLVAARKQPAFCLLRCVHAASFSACFRAGEGRLEALLQNTANMAGVLCRGYRLHDLDRELPQGMEVSAEQRERWFHNLNTPEDLAEAETWALSEDQGEKDGLRG